MNLLTDPLPSAVTVAGKDYPIRTDFKTWIRFDHLMTESDMPLAQKIVSVFQICFIEKNLPPNLEETLSSLFDFYTCFSSAQKSDNEQKEDSARRAGRAGRTGRVLSFTHDAPLVFAAVLAQYGVNLTEENPHWFLFRAMFEGLSKEHKICEVMGWRAMNLADVKDAKQRAFYRKMKRLYRLPDTRTPEQVEQDTLRSLSKII